MSEPDATLMAFRAFQQLLKSAEAADVAALRAGDGGGTTGGMEPRIARLEADMEHVKKSLDRLIDVPVTLAVLEERVSHLPTKGWMVAAIGTALAVIAALITFSDKIHALVS